MPMASTSVGSCGALPSISHEFLMLASARAQSTLAWPWAPLKLEVDLLRANGFTVISLLPSGPLWRLALDAESYRYS